MTLRLQDTELRCPNPDYQGTACGKMWALEVTRPWKFQCPRCKKTYQAAVDTRGNGGILEA